MMKITKNGLTFKTTTGKKIFKVLLQIAIVVAMFLMFGVVFAS